MSDSEWDSQMSTGAAVLRDADRVLTARQRLDALALDVLAAPGMAGTEVARLTSFLRVDWHEANAAAGRLLVLGETQPGRAGSC